MPSDRGPRSHDLEDRREEDPAPRRLSDHLKEYLREPTLWPVATAAIAIFVTLGATLWLLAVVQRHPAAMLALALLAGMSVDQWLRELRSGGLGVVSALIAGFWVLSGAVAFTVAALGLF